MKQKNKTKTVYLLLHWFIILVWVTCIFALSAQPAKESNSLSLMVTTAIIKGAAQVFPGQPDMATIQRLALKYNGPVRKIAHGMVYFLLGLLASKALQAGGMKGATMYVVALLFCLLYAITDEWHQVLTAAGRSGQISDVLLDTAGAAMGIGVYRLYSCKRA